MCPVFTVTLKHPLLFFLVYLSVLTILALPIAKLPIWKVRTVFRGTTFSVNNLPATLTFNPDKLPGLIVLVSNKEL